MAREIKALLDEEIAQYTARNPESRAMFERAKQSLPGGNTRTGVHIDPFPIYADYGAGTYLYDVDGRQLLDFVNNNTALPARPNNTRGCAAGEAWTLAGVPDFW